jgi:hypothetical protein
MTQVAKKLTKVEKCRKRANYVLGYTLPTFTEEEWGLRNKLKNYESWTPNTRYWSGVEGEPMLPKPQPETPMLSAELKERIKMYDNWVSHFNSYCDNLF